MSKRYEFEFKMKVTLEYFKGHLGYKFLAKKYNISSNRVKIWVNQYRQHGTQGLSHKLTYNRYSRDFKLSVLRYRQDHMLSYRETANYFNLPNPLLITQWQTNFDKAGLLGVTQKPKGRPANMKQKQSNSNQKITNSEKEEFEGLRVENEALRADIAYQKKATSLDSISREQTSQKVKLIFELRHQFSLKMLCKISNMAKSIVCYWLKKFNSDDKNKQIKEAIKRICIDSNYKYGYRRVTLALNQLGYRITQKKSVEINETNWIKM